MIVTVLLYIGALGFVIWIYECERRRLAATLADLWRHIERLEDDKRALTESLCRAEGKPYIEPRMKREFVVSDGWFDAQPQIKVKNGNETA